VGPGGLTLAELLLEWERQWDMQNPLAADQGKHFSGCVPLCVAGQNAATPATPAAACLPQPRPLPPLLWPLATTAQIPATPVAALTAPAAVSVASQQS
jgi:hypothetical protein